MQDITSVELNLIIDFFSKLPFLDDFININMKYYFNKSKAQKEFEKKCNLTYSEIYSKIFKTN